MGYRRLCCAFLGLFVWSISGAASANDGVFPTASDAMAYCQKYWADANPDVNYCNDSSAWGKVTGKKYSGVYRSYLIGECPAGEEPVGEFNKCVAPPLDPECPDSGSAGAYTFQGSAPASVCDGSCMLTKSGPAIGTPDGSGGTTWLAGMDYTGERCDTTGDALQPTVPPSDPLPDPSNPCYTDTSTPETTDCTLVNDKGDEVPPGDHGPDEICEEVNGAFGCTHPEEEGCDYRNGEQVCYYPDGTQVPSDSPDHPDNGGNMDGRDNNDPLDPRTPEEGGDPNNQPGDSTGEGGGATEGTAREGVRQQKLTNQKLDSVNKNLDQVEDGLGGLGKGIGTLNRTTEDIREAVDAAVDATRGDPTALENGVTNAISESGDTAVDQYDQLIDGMSEEGPMEASDLMPMAEKVNDVFWTGGACTDISFGTQQHMFTLTCSDIQPIRDMLGWVLYAFTVIRLFQIVKRPVPGAA